MTRSGRNSLSGQRGMATKWWTVEGAAEGSGLLGADAAEFGQVGAKHSCGDGADTRDGPQDRGAASQGFVGFEGLGNGLVEHTDLAVGSLVEAAERGRRGSGTEFGDALATVCPILDTGGSGRQQVLQLLEIAFQWKRPAPARQAPEESQHGGIDAIGLGEPTHAARKLPGLERVGQDDLQAGLVEAALQGPMVASSWLEHYAPHAQPAQPVARRAPAAGSVGKAAGGSARLDLHVELGLADIHASDEVRRSEFHVIHDSSSSGLQYSEYESSPGLGFSSIRASRPTFRPGLGGMVAAGRPSSFSIPRIQPETVRPAARPGGLQAPGSGLVPR